MRVVAFVLFAMACGGPDVTPAPRAVARERPPAPAAPVVRNFVHHLAGSPADVVTEPRGGIVLAGGGADVDEAFRWMIERAGGGDLVVLRASGDGAYDEYLVALGGLDSAETLVLWTATAAEDPFVAGRIEHAEAVFLAGGDQSHYLALFRGTRAGRAIEAAVERGVVIGGTSAGLAVLGEHAYSGERGSVTSPVALANPFDADVTLAPGLFGLPVLRGTITDTHFHARDRMGRLLAFMARIAAGGGSGSVRGIGVDERTAMLVDENGIGSVIGSGAVYVLDASAPAARCAPNEPLLFEDVAVRRLRAGDRFDLEAGTGGGQSYRVTAKLGAVDSTTGDVY